MCLNNSGCTPTYRGVYVVGMVQGVCTYIGGVVHPLILGLCGYGTWCMCLYYSGCTPTYRGVKVGMVHGELQWLHTHLYRSLCGSSAWCMCLYSKGYTPTYRGVYVGMVHIVHVAI